MNKIQVIPLGAGQDVGRSCILVTLNGKRIMFDCGMHMGYNDDRRFPDFSFITSKKPLDEYLDCVIISHFHLDHCGALPYMSEMVGYNGPIYMTYPTKAIAPILLEDLRKITVERKGDQNFFTTEMIFKAMSKVRTVSLHEIVKVDESLEIKPFYAGHVLGAAMFHVRVGNKSVVYTGDYNMTPDRHLGAASIDCCEPDLLITETTYATTIRDSKRTREQEFLDNIYHIVENGGKVLIPVFALGRAQELCILLESYWERKNLTVPIYFSTGMAEKANEYYRLFISWTNQKIKEVFVERNMFDFKHIKPLLPGIIDNPGPMVVFATPGMLNAGQSLNIFRKWAPDPKNAVIIPGYCVAGTVGYKILNGVKKLDFDGHNVDVKMHVEYLSFSAHADARGIMQLISQCKPKNVLLVHGEAGKMEFLCGRIMSEFKIPCFMPANGEVANIDCNSEVYVDCPIDLVERKAVNLERKLIKIGYNQSEVMEEHLANLGLSIKTKDSDKATPSSAGVVMPQVELIEKNSLDLFNLFFTLNHVHVIESGKGEDQNFPNTMKNIITRACQEVSLEVSVEKCQSGDNTDTIYDLLPTSISIAIQFLPNRSTPQSTPSPSISNNLDDKKTSLQQIPIYCTFLDKDENKALKLFAKIKSDLEKKL